MLSFLTIQKFLFDFLILDQLILKKEKTQEKRIKYRRCIVE